MWVYILVYIFVAWMFLLIVPYAITFKNHDIGNDSDEIPTIGYFAIILMSILWPFSLIAAIIIFIGYLLSFLVTFGHKKALKDLAIRNLAKQIYEDNKAGSTHLMTWKDCMKEAKQNIENTLNNQ